MQTFDVPGIALAVVKDDRVVVAKGYGVRKLGEPPSAPRTEPANAGPDVHTRAAEDRLRFALGTKVRILRRAEGGTIETWETINPAFTGKIVLFGRQNNSGTYDYLREHVCGKTPEGKQREFRAGISELNGSSEVVENVAKTPTSHRL